MSNIIHKETKEPGSQKSASRLSNLSETPISFSNANSNTGVRQQRDATGKILMEVLNDLGQPPINAMQQPNEKTVTSKSVRKSKRSTSTSRMKGRKSVRRPVRCNTAADIKVTKKPDVDDATSTRTAGSGKSTRTRRSKSRDALKSERRKSDLNMDEPMKAQERDKVHRLVESMQCCITALLDYAHESRQRTGTLVLCPIPISLAMASVYEGATDETATEITDRIFSQLRPEDALPDIFSKFLNSLRSGEPNTLEFAHNMYNQLYFPYQSVFNRTISQDYNADIHPVDFKEAIQEARNSIMDKWDCSSSSKYSNSKSEKGKSDQKMSPRPRTASSYAKLSLCDHMTRIVLVTSMVCRSSWKFEFRPEKIQTAKFTCENGNQIDSTFLGSRRRILFASNSTMKCRVIGLQCTKKFWIVYFILPDHNTSIEQLVKNFSSKPNELTALMHSCTVKSVHMLIPEITVRSEICKLNAEFRKLGVKSLFNLKNSKLGRISTRTDNNYHASHIVHQAELFIRADGFEIAGATVVDLSLSLFHKEYEDIGPPLSKTLNKKKATSNLNKIDSFSQSGENCELFHADRPFIIAMVERKTQTLLFYGIYGGNIDKL